jgi:hypothetical protein
MMRLIRSLVFKQSTQGLQASSASGFPTKDAAIHGYSKPKETPMSNDKPSD